MWTLYHQVDEYRLAIREVTRDSGKGMGQKEVHAVVSNVSVSWPAAGWACKAVWAPVGRNHR